MHDRAFFPALVMAVAACATAARVPLAAGPAPGPAVAAAPGPAQATPGAPPSRPITDVFDLVIRGGRVMDPASGTDMVANVGISNGKVAVITPEPLRGRRELNASNLVVAPGFIDILAGPPRELEGQRFKAMDGVTTVVAMHGGPVEIDTWYAERAKARSIINYGTTIGHGDLREKVGVTDRYQAATDQQIQQMVALAARGIEEGAIGIGFGLEYVPGASRMETFELFRTAARYDVPCHLHIRFSDPEPPGTNFEAVEEVIAAVAVSGASAQIVHINSTGGTWTMEQSLRLIEDARLRGLDVMADMYPYEAWSTGLTTARFDEGFLQRFRVQYSDIELVATAERLTEETFKKYRASTTEVPVIAHAMPKADLVMAIKHPLVMIGSDGVIDKGRGHPRGSGTFARILGRFVRDEGHLPLMEALRKMTIMAAERLEKSAPMMRDKGRLKVGADADITVFDPRTIIDRGTYQNPAQYSDGVRHVLVNGVPVVENGQPRDGAWPGRPIRRLR